MIVPMDTWAGRFSSTIKRIKVSPEMFQVSPRVALALPEPEAWMEGKARKLDYLTREQIEQLKECLSVGFSKAYEQEMPAGQITLELFQRTPRDEPDIGLGPMADIGKIILAVNPDKIATSRFQDTLKRIIPHECNHVMRTSLFGNPVTIGDAILSEGFALKAEILAGLKPADYNKPAHVEAFAAYIEAVLPALNTPRDPEGNAYNYWMFGMRAKDDRPNEAFGGYPLGHAVIASYLAAGHSMHDAMRTPNCRIFDHWKLELGQNGKITAKNIHAWASKNFHWVDLSADFPARENAVREPARHNDAKSLAASNDSLGGLGGGPAG